MKVSLMQYTDLWNIFAPVTLQDIVPPCHKKNKHTLDNLHSKRPMIVPVFYTVKNLAHP